MITVFFAPSFVRQYKKLAHELRDETDEKIAIFQSNPHFPALKFHKLKGRLKGFQSFSVNFTYRIIVEEDKPGVFTLLAIGDHDVYK